MADRSRFLDRITIPVPCNADWDSMSGNNQVRFCRHCNLHVSDLSSITRQNAIRLVARSQGRLCVRYVQLPGGGVLTKAPEKLYRIGRRVSRMAAGAFTATLTLSAVAAQTGLKPGADGSRQAIVSVIPTPSQGAGVSGLITDPNGAVVLGATVSLINKASSLAFNCTTGDDGTYKFSLLEAGVYDLLVEAHGFARSETSDLHLGPDTNKVFDLQVNLPVFTELAKIQDLPLTLRASIQVMGGAVAIRMPEDPLVSAAFRDDLDAVKQLVLMTPDVNVSDKATDQTALAYAIEHGNREMVRTLLAA